MFATALVAFFAVTGRSYWRACSSHPPDLAAWESEIVASRASASERAKELGVSLPASFDAPFARALSALPSDRFDSVGAFAAALATAAGMPVTDSRKLSPTAVAPAAPRTDARGGLRGTMVGIGAPSPSHRRATVMGIGGSVPRAAAEPVAAIPAPEIARPAAKPVAAAPAPEIARPAAKPVAAAPAPDAAFVPPPPAQMGAMLAAFETAAPPTAVRAEAQKPAAIARAAGGPPPVLAQVEERKEPSPVDDVMESAGMPGGAARSARRCFWLPERSWQFS